MKKIFLLAILMVIYLIGFSQYDQIETKRIKIKDSINLGTKKIQPADVDNWNAKPTYGDVRATASDTAAVLRAAIALKLDTGAVFIKDVTFSNTGIIHNAPSYTYNAATHSFGISQTLATQTANTVFAAPNGSSGAPTFRSLVATDIPTLSYLPIAGGSLTGTGGTGFVGFIAQSATPATPSSGFRLFAESTGKLAWVGTNGFTRIFDGSANTANQTYTLPNATGTIPLLSLAQTFSASQTFSSPTTADGAQIGAELLTAANWTSAGWNGAFNTFTHTVGNTTALSNTLAAVNGTRYIIRGTVTGRTAGTVSITFGGVTTTGILYPFSLPISFVAISTGALSIVPTTDFDATISLSITTISASTATTSFTNNTGTVFSEIRVGGNTTNTLYGLNAGSLFAKTSGTYIYESYVYNNTAFGFNALSNSVISSNNTAIGFQALQNNSTGGVNTAVGSNALRLTTTGSSNTANGESAGYYNIIGSGNSFFGRSSGTNSTGSNNTFYGNNSGLNINAGSANTLIGSDTRMGIGSSSNNAALGSSNLNQVIGSNNTAIGTNAALYAGSVGTAITAINNSIFLGYLGKALNATGDDNEIVIGNNVVGLGSNTTIIGNTSTTFTSIYGKLIIGTTTDAGNGILQVTGNLALNTAGSKILVATGSNASAGTATLVSGTVTISTTAVTANSLIFVEYTGTLATTSSVLNVSSRVAGTSFTVKAFNAGAVTTNTSDANSIKYWIIN